jgi:hypothetical protein
MSQTKASFRLPLSEPSLDFLDSLGFAWELVTESESESNKQKFVLRELDNQHELIFELNDYGSHPIATMAPNALLCARARNDDPFSPYWNIWMKSVEPLLRLIVKHDIHAPESCIQADEKVQKGYCYTPVPVYTMKQTLESMEYPDLLKFYHSIPETPKRRGLTKDRVSLIRRLMKLKAAPYQSMYGYGEKAQTYGFF